MVTVLVMPRLLTWFTLLCHFTPFRKVNYATKNTYIHQNFVVLNIASGSEANITTSCEMEIFSFLWLIWDHYNNKKIGYNAIWTVISCCWQHYANSVKIIKPFSIHFSGPINLIVGGYGGGFKSDAQIVDLSSQTRSCNNFQDYPIAMRSATGAIVSGQPIICGGYSGYYHSECYKYSKGTSINDAHFF